MRNNGILLCLFGLIIVIAFITATVVSALCTDKMWLTMSLMIGSFILALCWFSLSLNAKGR